MNSHKNVLLFALFALAAVCCAPIQALPLVRSVPPASFLNYHVDTVPQLTFEVTYDRTVQARLAHHFHLSGPALCAYVRRSLVLKRLTAPCRTRVYCISPRGREYFVVMILKRGTPVFALRRTGRPILRLVCGNPLVAALPASSLRAAPRGTRHPAAPHVGSAKIARAAPTPAPAPAAPTSAPGASVPGESSPVVSALPQAPAEVVFTQASAGGSGIDFVGATWLPVAGVLTLGGFLTHGGVGGLLVGGNRTGRPVSPLIPGSETPPGLIPAPSGPVPMPTPEPATPWVFVTGALALAVRRLVGKRSLGAGK